MKNRRKKNFKLFVGHSGTDIRLSVHANARYCKWFLNNLEIFGFNLLIVGLETSSDYHQNTRK